MILDWFNGKCSPSVLDQIVLDVGNKFFYSFIFFLQMYVPSAHRFEYPSYIRNIKTNSANHDVIQHFSSGSTLNVKECLCRKPV